MFNTITFFPNILCIGLERTLCCLSESAITYKTERIDGDSLLKKFLSIHGGFVPYK